MSSKSFLSLEDALASIQRLEPRLSSLNSEECLSLVHSYLQVAQHYLQQPDDSTHLSKEAWFNAELQELKNRQLFESYVQKSLQILNEQPLPQDGMLLSDWYFLKISLYLLIGDPLLALQACNKCEETVNTVGNLVFKSLLLEQLQQARQQCELSLKDLNQPEVKAPNGFIKHSFMLGLLRQDQESWLNTPNLFYERLAYAKDFVVVEYAQYKVDPRQNPDYFSFLVRAQYYAESIEAEHKRNETLAAERQEFIRRKQERLNQEQQLKSYEDIITSDLDSTELTRQLKLLNERNKNYVPDPLDPNAPITSLGGLGMAESLTSLNIGGDPQSKLGGSVSSDALGNQDSGSLDEDESSDKHFSSVDFAKSRAISFKEAAKQEKLLKQDQFQNAPVFHVFYKEQIFKARIFATEIDKLFLNWRARFPLTQEELKSCANLRKGVAVVIEGGNNPYDTYKLQLLMLCTIVPQVLLVVDESSEQIYPGDWVRFASQLKSDVDSQCLFSIQAVSDRNRVWLHTHGLSRFKLGELEILDCPQESYNSYGSLLDGLATSYLNGTEKMEAYQPQLVAHLDNDKPLVSALVPWPEAVQFYSSHLGDEFLGSAKDRDSHHNALSYAIFCYENEADYKAKHLKPLTVYGNQINSQTVVLYSQRETLHQQQQAQETLKYLLYYASCHPITILVKVALTVDEANQASKPISPKQLQQIAEANEKAKLEGNESGLNIEQPPVELCWFVILNVYDNGTMQGRLDNEPFYISNLHTGDLMNITPDVIVDWRGFDLNSKTAFTPSSAFLLTR